MKTLGLLLIFAGGWGAYLIVSGKWPPGGLTGNNATYSEKILPPVASGNVQVGTNAATKGVANSIPTAKSVQASAQGVQNTVAGGKTGSGSKSWQSTALGTSAIFQHNDQRAARGTGGIY